MPLDHVALTVADRERSAAFYADHFGLTERVHDDEHLLILGDRPGSLLALRQGDPPTLQLPRGNHFGFRVATPADVTNARERFRAAGIEEIEFDASGPTRVQVEDPDGYRVELYAY